MSELTLGDNVETRLGGGLLPRAETCRIGLTDNEKKWKMAVCKRDHGGLGVSRAEADTQGTKARSSRILCKRIIIFSYSSPRRQHTGTPGERRHRYQIQP
jgi:hypothetical protein